MDGSSDANFSPCERTLGGRPPLLSHARTETMGELLTCQSPGTNEPALADGAGSKTHLRASALSIRTATMIFSESERHRHRQSCVRDSAEDPRQSHQARQILCLRSERIDQNPQAKTQNPDMAERLRARRPHHRHRQRRHGPRRKRVRSRRAASSRGQCWGPEMQRVVWAHSLSLLT